MNHKKKISIIIPCLNEELNIIVLVKGLIKNLEPLSDYFEVILIDDGSSDNTYNYMLRESSKDKRIIVLKHTGNLGIAKSWATGLRQSKGDYLITTDADMQYSPDDIITLINQMDPEKYDIIQGVRKKYKQNSVVRTILSRIFGKILCLSFNMNLYDPKSGFVLYKKEVFAEILKYNRGFHFFQHYIMVFATLLNYRIKEADIIFYPRYSGLSSISSPLIFGFKSLLELPKVIIYYKREKKKICAE